MKQLIIARKDLDMSPGKLAAQVSHGSMAFLTNMIRNRTVPNMKTEKLPVYDKYRYAKPGQEDPNPPIMLYRHPQLYEWAKQFAKEGKEYFYVYEPDPENHPHQLELVNEPIIEDYKTTMFIDKDIYEQWIQGSFTKVVCKAKNKNKLLKAVEYAKELGLKEGIDFFLIYDNCLTELDSEEEDGTCLTVIGFRPLPDEQMKEISRHFQLYN